jgi:hypothetical protein
MTRPGAPSGSAYLPDMEPPLAVPGSSLRHTNSCGPNVNITVTRTMHERSTESPVSGLTFQNWANIALGLVLPVNTKAGLGEALNVVLRPGLTVFRPVTLQASVVDVGPNTWPCTNAACVFGVTCQNTLCTLKDRSVPLPRIGKSFLVQSLWVPADTIA